MQSHVDKARGEATGGGISTEVAHRGRTVAGWGPGRPSQSVVPVGPETAEGGGGDTPSTWHLWPRVGEGEGMEVAGGPDFSNRIRAADTPDTAPNATDRMNIESKHSYIDCHKNKIVVTNCTNI